MSPARILSCSLLATGVLFVRVASATELEPVRFEVEAPDGCVDETSLRNDVSELGGAFRDANLEDRARTFRVEVTRTNEGVRGKLVVRDLVFRETVRTATAEDCAELARALALFVATALDERDGDAATVEPAPVSPPLAPWPAPAPDASSMTRRRGRRGSGGLAASMFASGLLSATSSEGIRTHGVLRVVGTTRIGLAGAVAQEDRYRVTDVSIDTSTGVSTRIGGVVAWGAPWNDSVVGFAAEAGVTWSRHRGQSRFFAPRGVATSAGFCGLGAECRHFVEGDPAQRSWSHVSPYVAWQLVWQVPFKSSPVRPVAAFGALWVPGIRDNGAPAATAELGVVWQAW